MLDRNPRVNVAIPHVRNNHEQRGEVRSTKSLRYCATQVNQERRGHTRFKSGGHSPFFLDWLDQAMNCRGRDRKGSKVNASMKIVQLKPGSRKQYCKRLYRLPTSRCQLGSPESPSTVSPRCAGAAGAGGRGRTNPWRWRITPDIIGILRRPIDPLPKQIVT